MAQLDLRMFVNPPGNTRRADENVVALLVLCRERRTVLLA